MDNIYSGLQIADDSSYPSEAYAALQDTARWLKDGVYGWGPDNLLRICKDMESSAPFMPPYKTSGPRPLVAPGGQFKFRRPVWDAISVRIDTLRSPARPFGSITENSKWLQEKLRLCLRFRQYQRVLEHFKTELKKLNIAPQEVRVTGTFDQTGEVPVEIVLDMIHSLSPVLQEMMLKKSA